MENEAGIELLRAASEALPAPKGELLRVLHRFTGRRRAAAGVCRGRLLDALAAEDADAAEAELHAFLRESWEALDGLAREVNLCMEHLFPEVGLYPPLEMTRQCTFYVVRKKLHEHPATASHPVTRLLWARTRERPDAAYRRVSFLYNLSLFCPVPLGPGGMLPGSDDIPHAVRPLLKPSAVPPAGAGEASGEILRWLAELSAQIYATLAASLVGG